MVGNIVERNAPAKKGTCKHSRKPNKKQEEEKEKENIFGWEEPICGEITKKGGKCEILRGKCPHHKVPSRNSFAKKRGKKDWLETLLQT